ncbi:50S ribosomal protein L23 [bacterium]|nr:50S ribosomal protein L23 [bacterium]
MNPYRILISPIITEKTTIQKAESNTITFKVHIDASKEEIKKAVSTVFNVKVVDIRTIRMKGKPKRMGRFSGRRSNWKKAIVQLAYGEKIPYFEGA